ncbi:IS66 family insertion sequence element accessory protein TnpB [Pseudomonas syringae]|uniref:IS66 family insertion sequence element accessory protein TnpB n=2 Tax=Pseudomonas syringae group TaxID=136849 RepID=A0ABX6HD75_9PSED|nr:IS66 family insertion sequence element accessory protein TnpB [Pseudomonas asturiensis]
MAEPQPTYPLFPPWLAIEPMDMRAGTETALARVVAVFGAAKPHCAYLLANRRANRIKVLVHDGVGIWLAARRLNQGRFFWPGVRHSSELAALDCPSLVRPWRSGWATVACNLEWSTVEATIFHASNF